MGTRSETRIRSRWDDGEYQTHAHIFRHWDGYPEDHGKYLFDFLDGRSIVNGITGQEKKPFANGPGRVASQLVHQMQEDGHDPILESQHRGQEFEYEVDIDFGMRGGVIAKIRVFNGEKIFEGDLPSYGKWIEKKCKK